MDSGLIRELHLNKKQGPERAEGGVFGGRNDAASAEAEGGERRRAKGGEGETVHVVLVFERKAIIGDGEVEVEVLEVVPSGNLDPFVHIGGKEFFVDEGDGKGAEIGAVVEVEGLSDEAGEVKSSIVILVEVGFVIGIVVGRDDLIEIEYERAGVGPQIAPGLGEQGGGDGFSDGEEGDDVGEHAFWQVADASIFGAHFCLREEEEED